MKIIFLRHAESTNNAIEKGITREEYTKLRNADPPLSEYGIKQVKNINSQITLQHSSAKIKYG
jgi:broad specificity phosphatase PhoE